MALKTVHIDLENIRYGSTLFRVKRKEDCVELYRQNKHLLRPDNSDPRWCLFPVTMPVRQGGRYRIRYTVRASCDMEHGFFLSVGRQVQTFGMAFEKNRLHSGEVEFTAELGGDACITVTATDLPIASNYLWIYQLCFEEVE